MIDFFLCRESLCKIFLRFWMSSYIYLHCKVLKTTIKNYNKKWDRKQNRQKSIIGDIKLNINFRAAHFLGNNESIVNVTKSFILKYWISKGYFCHKNWSGKGNDFENETLIAAFQGRDQCFGFFILIDWVSRVLTVIKIFLVCFV